MCAYVQQCVLMFSNVCLCSAMCAYVEHCVLMFSTVCLWWAMCAYVQQCVLMFSNVCLCWAMCAYVQQCVLMFSTVCLSSAMCAYVQQYVLIFSTVEEEQCSGGQKAGCTTVLELICTSVQASPMELYSMHPKVLCICSGQYSIDPRFESGGSLPQSRQSA
jgi:hypothetical protein